MATASEKAKEWLKSQWYSEWQIADASAKIKSQQSQWASRSDIINDIRSNTSSYTWGNAMYGSSSSSSWSSSSWLTSKSNNTNSSAWDIYWDVNGNRTWATPMDFSNTSWTIDESTLSFGKNAHAKQASDSSYLTNRNNNIASYLYNQKITDEEWISKYLSKFSDFTDAEDGEQKNTIWAIKARLWEISKEKWDNWLTGKDDWVTWVDTWSINEWEGKAWYYLDGDGNYYKIYGYDELSEQDKALADRMSETQKKELSNKWAQGMQDDVKTVLDAKRDEEQLKAVQDIKEKLHDNSMEQFAIQTEQTIRNAEESYNNLKQNWQYLGNLGMPWTSSTKIQAIGDCITEAKTQLWELKKLLALQEDAKNLEWKWQVLNYTQQLDNLAYDLRWKVGDELTWLLSKFTAAELEWKLDTIDGITAFKRELLDDLDANLSGLTSASLSQMQYINQEYQKIADKAYEYAQNANTVNKDMSAVKWYYVDGNGNPILDNMGKVIKIQNWDWMEPVFDKETWRLITFTYDENGNRTANVEQLWDNTTSNPPIYSWMSGLSSSTWWMRTERNNNPTAMITDVAKSLWGVEGVDYVQWDSWTNSEWKTYYTAKLLGDPIETTIKLLDRAASTGRWAFYTKWGKQRWTHTAMSDAAWLALSPEEKKNTVLKMLQREWGSIDNMQYYLDQNQSNLWWNKFNNRLIDLFKKDQITEAERKEIKEDFWMNMAQFWDAKEAWLAQQAGETDTYWKIKNIRDAIWYLATNYPWRWKLLTASWKWILWKIGVVEEAMKMNPELATYVKKVDFLLKNLTEKEFLDMKQKWATFGAMSNAEWDIIQQAATDLDAYQSEEEFMDTLVTIYNQYADDAVKAKDINALRSLYSTTPQTQTTVNDTVALPSQQETSGNTVWWYTSYSRRKK